MGAVGLLLVGLWCSFWMAHRQTRINEQVAAERFAVLATKVQSELMQRVTRYQYGLRGVRGAVLTAGPERIDRSLFRAYHESRDIKVEFDGARGFGFIRRVPADQVDGFVKQARQDGQPDFSIHGFAPNAAERYVIQYIEPIEDNREAVGVDIASERARREAAQQAMRTGQATLTSPVTLVQVAQVPKRSFLVLLPIYRLGMPTQTPEQREAATYGWSYAPLVIDDVLRDIGPDRPDYALALSDAPQGKTPERFLGRAAEATMAPGLINRTRLQVFGRTWLIETRATDRFVQGLGLLSPQLVFAMSAAASCLIASLV